MHLTLISAAFDDLRSPDMRLMEDASRRGPLTVCLWSDAAVKTATGRDPKFPEAERRYFVESIRYVSRVVIQPTPKFDRSITGLKPNEPGVLFERERNDSAKLRAVCSANNLQLEMLSESSLSYFPSPPMCPVNPKSTRKKVIVTGSFDWFHTGHVRFFEEANEIGDLYVVVGHDANIRLLKGDGHPMFPSAERCYIANSVKFAKVAIVSTGNGWLDAEPEILKIKPDIYVVNEDGDRPEKKQYCKAHGIEYRVLKRKPRPGLSTRSSTNLRGF